MKKFFALVTFMVTAFTTINAQVNPINVTAVPDENRTDWVYVITMNTDRGTLPIVVRRDLSAVKLVGISNGIANSAYFVSECQKWLPAVVSVGPDWLEWHSTENKMLGNMTYSSAIAADMELFAKVNLSVAPNETRSGWVYVVNLVTNHGTLPIIVRPDLSQAELAEVTSETTNSAYFNKERNKWMPAVAVNGNGYMEWLDNGTVIGDLSYLVAIRWGMPQRNGSPSVNL